MQIKDFENIRAGSGWPHCIDIMRIAAHESYGVAGVAHTYASKHTRKIQLRQTDTAVALFHFMTDDQSLPCGWENSVIIWELNIPAAAR